MCQYTPDYYKDFHCIAKSCRHNCCIGWEIDIDEESAEHYAKVTGDMGKRLKASIDWEEVPHFRLGKGERCPFLNPDNLCDLILSLGEDSLCSICREHPRFRNELPERVEIGLGLCCEEAARLILGRREPMMLIVEGKREEPDEILMLRDEVLSILQDRRLTLTERIEAMLSLCGCHMPHFDSLLWRDRLISLERMDESWTAHLALLTEGTELLSSPIIRPQEEYEQILVYLIYRHFANAWNDEEIAVRAYFAVFGFWLIGVLGRAVARRVGRFDFDDQVELCRLFSAEIEYSDENRDAVFDWLRDDNLIT